VKVKVIEITKSDAREKLIKEEKGIAFISVLCLMLVMVALFVPDIPSVFSMMFTCVGVVGVFAGLAMLMAVSFARSDIKALNILFYGFKKFILKEVKDV
jgi:predicted Na+-dependent transporter